MSTSAVASPDPVAAGSVHLRDVSSMSRSPLLQEMPTMVRSSSQNTVRTWINSPDSGSIAWGARAGSHLRHGSLNSLEGDKSTLRLGAAGTTSGQPRRLSLDQSPLTPEWTLGKRGSGLSLGTERSRGSDNEQGEITTVHRATPYSANRFLAAASTPALIGLYPLGNELLPPRRASLEPAESAVLESEESDASAAVPPMDIKTKRQAGLFMPGAWEDQLSSDSRSTSFNGVEGLVRAPPMVRRESPLRKSVSRDNLREASGSNSIEETPSPVHEAPAAPELQDTSAATPILPNTFSIGEGVAGGPQRDERGKRIDIARWRRQDPLLRDADAAGSRSPAVSPLAGLKKRFSRSLASLLPSRSTNPSPTRKQAATQANTRSTADFNAENQQRRFAASTDQLDRVRVPQRTSSSRRSLVISGPYDIAINGRARPMSASTPNLSDLQRDGRRSRPDSKPKVAEWLQRQSVVEEEAEAVHTVKTPVDTPSAAEHEGGGAAEYFEALQPPGLDSDTSDGRRESAPVSHTRDISAASTINLATPHTTAPAVLADAQGQDKRRTRRKSLFGLSAFAGLTSADKPAPTEPTKPDMRHSRSSSFAKLKTVFSGGRRKSSSATPIESPSLHWEHVDTGSYNANPSVERFSRPKSPFERFVFPKMHTSERKAAQVPVSPVMNSPPFQREPIKDSSVKRDRRRSGRRSSGDWGKLVTSARTGLGRLASPSTPNLLSMQPRDESLNRQTSPVGSPGEKRMSILEALMADSTRIREETNAQPPEYEVRDRLDQQRYDPSPPSVPQFDSAGRPWLAEPVRPSPRTSSRPVVAVESHDPYANRLSRLTELEEDDVQDGQSAGPSRRGSYMADALRDQSKSELALPLALPLDLGSAFDVQSFTDTQRDLVYLTPTTELSQMLSNPSDASGSDLQLARIGQVVQTPYFQPATLRRLSGDGTEGRVELEVTFPMPPSTTSPSGATTPTRMAYPPVAGLPAAMRSDSSLAFVRNWSWRSESNRSNPSIASPIEASEVRV